MSSSRTYPWMIPDLRVHPASQVPSSSHHPALSDLLRLKISFEFIEYVVDYLVHIVSSRVSTSPAMAAPYFKQPGLFYFVANLVCRARVNISTVLVALSYLDRARPAIQARFEPHFCEKLFLGAFMVAHKYTNDVWMRAKVWSRLSGGVILPPDVVRAERDILQALGYHLQVSQEGLLAHYDPIMFRCAPSPFNWGVPHSTSPSPSLSPQLSGGKPGLLAENTRSVSPLSTTSLSSTPDDSPALLTPVDSAPATAFSAQLGYVKPELQCAFPAEMAHTVAVGRENHDFLSEELNRLLSEIGPGRNLNGACAPPTSVSSQPSLLEELRDALPDPSTLGFPL